LNSSTRKRERRSGQGAPLEKQNKSAGGEDSDNDTAAQAELNPLRVSIADLIGGWLGGGEHE